NRFEQAGIRDWKIYFHDVAQAHTLLKLFLLSNHFHFYRQFQADCQRGQLPSYSFIEPQYYSDMAHPENDQHPPSVVEQLIADVGRRQYMSKHENIAKALKARLSELTNRLVEINSELRKPLSADLEEQATDLENHGALEAIENSEIHEIHQIQEALKRISEGTYGICARCGEDIDPKRLKALPTATRCISCAV